MLKTVYFGFSDRKIPTFEKCSLLIYHNNLLANKNVRFN